MIAVFPEFSNLDMAHYAEVKERVSKFQPYSDFNFTSLYSWNVDGSTKVSVLNDNLVLSMPDYLSGEQISTLIGNKNIDETLRVLLDYDHSLKLVPQETVDAIKIPEAFEITEDIDNHDYIYSLLELSALAGKHYKTKRKMIHRFEGRVASPISIKEIDFNDNKTRDRILEVFAMWASDRGRTHEEISNEYRAIERMLVQSHRLKLLGSEIFIGSEPSGFTIHEIINDEYTVCHFHKTILKNVGIDVYLTVHAAKELHAKGFRYENWEQDLGLPGLRTLKSSYQPVKMLKKYTVKKR